MLSGFARKLLSLIFLVAAVASHAQQPSTTEDRFGGVPAPAPARQRRPQSASPRKDIPAIAKAADGAIVTIITAANDKPIAFGTGFLVSADGVIVTNYHVIETGNVAIVKFSDDSAFPVDGVLAADKVRDLAVIKIHGKTFRMLTLGNSDRVQVGEEVVAIGNPLGLELTVSNGILSGVRTVEKEGGKFLQVTAPISHGSSGGPLFNMAGEVIGITSMYFEGGENLNFAIPVNDAKLLLLNRSAKLQNLPNEVKKEKETPKETSEVPDASSQLKACDEQAEKFARYKRQNYKVPLRIGYVNHYDAKANKCYVETVIDFGDGQDPASKVPLGWFSGKSYSIYDAFFEGDGGPAYGEFYFRPGGQCHIWPYGSSSSREIACRSEEEFDELASKYFGMTQAAAPTVSVNRPNNLPPNTRIAAGPPDPANATPEQLWEDMKYCYQNPANSLWYSDGMIVSCSEINTVIEKCKASKGPCSSWAHRLESLKKDP